MSGPAYRDRRGDPVALGAELGAGGEGSVHALRDRPDLCAKIYRPDKAAARADKVHAMLARRPPWLLRGALTWPVEALHAGADPRSFVGFVMPTRRGMVELFPLLVPDERMAIAGWLTQRDLCLIAARIAGLVAGVHRAGHCVGDLKPQNILVAPRGGRVAIIDTDSFQIHDPESGTTHRSVVVTPEYAAPELAGVDLTRADRGPASDTFALAVLIHQILLGGAHPFEGDLAPGHAGSVERVPGRIRHGLCPFVPGVTAIRPASGALPFATLHEGLRALFVQCFGPGHAAPTERPSASAWQVALARAARAMVRCPANPAHLHDGALPRCPWCARRARLGIDLFPADQRWQRDVTATADPASVPEGERLRWLQRHVRGRISAGKVTAAERAWLEKTGAALGFDRARVSRTLVEQQREPEPAHVQGDPPALGARLGKLAARLRGSRPWTSLLSGSGSLGAMVARLRGPRRWPSLPSMRLRGLAARLRTSRRWPSLPGLRLRGLAPRRRSLLLSAVSLAAAAACAAGVLTTSARTALLAAEPSPRPVCSVAAQTAVIGNTRGRGAFLRTAPSTASDKLPLPEGTVVRLTGRARSGDDLVWSEVEVLGRAGWVASRYLVEPR